MKRTKVNMAAYYLANSAEVLICRIELSNGGHRTVSDRSFLFSAIAAQNGAALIGLMALLACVSLRLSK